MQPDVLDMVRADVARARGAADRNRADARSHGMEWAIDWLDALRAGGFESAGVAYLDNGNGWTIGRLDAGQFIDWRVIDSIARWNDRALGRVVRKEETPSRRNMTAAQQACLSGDL